MSVADESIGLLERSYANLVRRETPRDFFLHLEPFLQRLERDPRLGAHLHDMALEAESVHERLNATDDALIERLRAIRARVPRVESDEVTDRYDAAERYGLDEWDKIAEAPPDSYRTLLSKRTGDQLRANRLASHLNVRLESVYPYRDRGSLAEELQVTLRDFGAARDDVLFEERRASNYLETAGAIAYAKLRAVVRQLNPPRTDIADSASWTFDLMSELVGDPEELKKLLYGYATPKPLEVKKARINACDLLGLVYEDLRERVGTSLSRRALIMRFKVRSEAYDYETLRAIASDEASNKEDRLSERLAAFLFDNGLAPLTRPMIGRLIPDIVAPELYVEAKQYGQRKGTVETIRDGAKQIWDTFARLRGTAQEVREAYLVVFRRGGPNLVFEQETVRAGSLTIHCIFIDVAEGAVSGSRQSEKPITVTSADLLPERTDEPTAGAPR